MFGCSCGKSPTPPSPPLPSPSNGRKTTGPNPQNQPGGGVPLHSSAHLGGQQRASTAGVESTGKTAGTPELLGPGWRQPSALRWRSLWALLTAQTGSNAVTEAAPRFLGRSGPFLAGGGERCVVTFSLFPELQHKV